MGVAALIAAGRKPDDPPRSALFERNHTRALITLRAALIELQLLEAHLAGQPEDAATFGAISDRAGGLLENLRQEVVRFWNTTDCAGEA